MAQKLLSNFGRSGVSLGLLNKKVDIIDTNPKSNYFGIVQIPSLFTAGKNAVSFNGSSFLLQGSSIQVECLDSNGNSLYIESPKSSTQFIDIANFVISVFIYNNAYNGVGSLTLVGTTTQNKTVRWSTSITIDKTVQNSSRTLFYTSPSISARSLLYPVIDTTIGSSLTELITLTGSFTSFAATPSKDTIQSSINPKVTDVDYRLNLSSPTTNLLPSLYPTNSFNSQMEGQSIFLNINNIQGPFSYVSQPTSTTASFIIKKILNNNTLQLDNAFFYPYGSNQIVTNINGGEFTSSYTWTAYNTASNAYEKFVPISGSPIFVKQSYAEITYTNIGTFSGYVARHKLYRQSLVYPGDYQLVVDEPLGGTEILIDPISVNKAYNILGTFYNQNHINSYWFVNTSSVNLSLSASVSPMINSMIISAPPNQWPDGISYIIVKNNSPNTVNDSVYHPYDTLSYNELSGSSYNSNFINLQAGSLYVLSTNVIITKDASTTNASIGFYFTSSIPSITTEKNYISPFGLQIGTISTSDLGTTKIFSEKQMLFFTPANDYFGTLVIVPFNCNVTLSELSLQVYKDYGFSPNSAITRISFPVGIANEGYNLKSELYDINSTLIYSNLSTAQSFDPNGESLFSISQETSDPTKVDFISGSLSISQSLELPNIPSCPQLNTRLLAWNVPIFSPPLETDGEVCYTDVSQLAIGTTGGGISTVGDYLTLSTVAFSGSSLVTSTVTALNVKYDGSNNLGRKIIINNSGSKTMYP